MQLYETRFQAEEALIAALQAGDPDAWTELIERYDVLVHRYLRYNLPAHEDVEEMWSEIMLAAVSAIKELPQDVHLTTWLYSIAYRKVADYWRRRQSAVLLTDQNALYAKFGEQVRELPEQAQQALLLRYYAGLSIGEIAAVMGRSVKATESLLSRVRQQLGAAHDVALVAATDDRDQDAAPPHDKQRMGNSAYGLLLLQKAQCEQQGMAEEAQIFDRACQQLVTLFAIGTDAPVGGGNRLFRQVRSHDRSSADEPSV